MKRRDLFRALLGVIAAPAAVLASSPRGPAWRYVYDPIRAAALRERLYEAVAMQLQAAEAEGSYIDRLHITAIDGRTVEAGADA